MYASGEYSPLALLHDGVVHLYMTVRSGDEQCERAPEFFTQKSAWAVQGES